VAGILLTGATGYLGGNLARRLVGAGKEVWALIRNPGRSADLPPGVRAVVGDVTQAESLRRALQGRSEIIHSAAHVKMWDPEPSRFEAVNVGGLANILRVGQELGIQKIIYTSSFIALGPTDGTTGDEEWEVPQRIFNNAYERTKATADHLARGEARKGAPLVILYPGVIYGPGRLTDGNLMGKMIADFVAGRLPGMLGGGDRRFCYAFVEDVVEGHLAALEKGRPGERYILGGENRTTLELFAELEKITGQPAPRRRIPFAVAQAGGFLQRWRANLMGVEPQITDEVIKVYRHDWAYSSRRAEQALDYRITPFSEGLEAAVGGLQEEDS
jgi:farnesol dehydrogenase